MRRYLADTSAAGSATMLTARRPRTLPNVTTPPTSANRVSSPPRPTPGPRCKWVPRWRTRISPALTRWPPDRFTPSRCAALPGRDTSDLHLGVPLAVAQTAPVSRLVPVANHVDLGTGDGPHDLGGDLVAAQLGGVADDLAVIDDEHGGQRHAGADLAGERVDGKDVVHRRLLLPATAAHDRVHP